MDREVLRISHEEDAYSKIVMDQALVHLVGCILRWQARHRQERELVPNEKVYINEILVEDLRNEVTISSDNMDKNSMQSLRGRDRYDR